MVLLAEEEEEDEVVMLIAVARVDLESIQEVLAAMVVVAEGARM